MAYKLYYIEERLSDVMGNSINTSNALDNFIKNMGSVDFKIVSHSSSLNNRDQTILISILCITD